MVVLGYLLIIISSIAKAVMDKVNFHFENSIFNSNKLNKRFWDKKISWRNKWWNGDKSKGERFFLSSTILVFITDAWHLFQSIMLFSLFTGLYFIFSDSSLYSNLIHLISTSIMFRFIFTFIFHSILEKKL
jgi:hypothetical protein